MRVHVLWAWIVDAFLYTRYVVVTYTTEKPIRAVPPFLFTHTMTKFYLKTLLFCLLYIVGIAKAFAYTAYDIAAENADGVTIYYNYIKNKTELEVTLSSNNIGNSYSGNVVIPETVTLYGNTYRVTSIGDNAFSYCPGLTSVTVPNTVTSIASYAFKESIDLTSVTIGNGVTSIGTQAFEYCTSLVSVNIPSSVTSIGDYAFNFCI